MASVRQYATIEEVEQFADVTSLDDTEFEDRISQAEELIDAYVGFQQKHIRSIYHGQITALSNSNKTIADTSSSSSFAVIDDFFSYTVIELVSGNGAGQRGYVVSSDKDDKSITLRAAFSTTPAVGDVFKMYQLGKFPRIQDAYGGPNGDHYYKSIPDAVKRAVAAQVAFMIQQGDNFGGPEFKSESFLNYSYTRGDDSGGGSLNELIAPRAKVLLRGIVNRTGRIITGGPHHVGH